VLLAGEERAPVAFAGDLLERCFPAFEALRRSIQQPRIDGSARSTAGGDGVGHTRQQRALPLPIVFLGLPKAAATRKRHAGLAIGPLPYHLIARQRDVDLIVVRDEALAERPPTSTPSVPIAISRAVTWRPSA
jgi:hypothetical protein